MRYGKTIVLLLLFLATPTVGATRDLLIETAEGQLRVPAMQHEGHEYYRLSTLAPAMGCRLQTQDQTATVTGPAGTLNLTDGRALVRFNSEYILLSTPPWKTKSGDWYVAEDFFARALALVLQEPLRRTDSGSYSLGQASVHIDLELINRPDQVRVIVRSRQSTPISLMEYSDRIEVTLGTERFDIQFPPVRPNPRIVTSISQSEGFLIIRKGPQFDRFEDSQPMTGPGFVIDLFGRPSAIVTLPPRSSSPSSSSPTRPLERTAESEKVDATRFDQLQDWRWGPIERRRSPVVIDPGHGGEDLGVTRGDLMEKDIALEVAFRIQRILEREGHTCQLTRTRDVSLPIEQRSGIANYYQPHAFVSIHAGGSPSASTHCSAVYLYDHTSQALPAGIAKTPQASSGGTTLVSWREAQRAYITQSSLLGRLIQRNLATISENPSVFVEAPLTVLSAVGAPAVLVEIGFLTNPSQLEQLQSEVDRELIADAIAKSISTFLEDSNENSSTGQE